MVKLFKVGYYTRLLDLHRSNPFHYHNLQSHESDTFSSFSSTSNEGLGVSEAWLAKDVKNESSLLYTRSRDIHAVGIVFLQMLLGLDVTRRYEDVQSALRSSSISPSLQKHAYNMLQPPKKAHISCLTLLSDLADTREKDTHTPHSHSPVQLYQPHPYHAGPDGVMLSSSLSRAINIRSPPPPPHSNGHGYTNGNGYPYVPAPSTSPVTPFLSRTGHPYPYPDPKTPMPNPQNVNYGSSPEEYFPPPQPSLRLGPRPMSRWKEDWEELELLGKGAFGSVVKARNKVDNRIYAVKKVKLNTKLPPLLEAKIREKRLKGEGWLEVQQAVAQAQHERDKKFFREVTALSRLSHRFIVRYYTTWVETVELDPEGISRAASEFDSDEEDSGYDETVSGATKSGRRVASADTSDGLVFSLDDLDQGGSRGSFPSIHFSRSADSTRRGIPSHELGIEADTEGEDTEESSSDSDGDPDSFGLEAEGGLPGSVPIPVPETKTLTTTTRPNRARSGTLMVDEDPFIRAPTIEDLTPPPVLERTLYIQMEFVERQTLRELVDEGITEAEAWRLFQQIVDALVHMAGLGILHRDIKLTNIFIDGNGDCKIGDFGLATSSLAAVDPSDVSPAVVTQPDMTLEVGTKLYIAPEVQTRTKKGGGAHVKADLYSLGIVFFEMNYMFSTGSERIAVIERLRKPEIVFPSDWDPNLKNQREIITWLLNHDPDKRPTAEDLSRSPLLPPRVEDEYLKGALKMMTKPDSEYRQAVLHNLFSQTPKAHKPYVYDADLEPPKHYPLNSVVQERLTSIFRLHGAVDSEPPLLMAVKDPKEAEHQATFIDRHGELVALPNDLLVPFARSASREGIQRIKRFHLDTIWKANTAAGHPKGSKAGIFDIITPDVTHGPVAAGAEILAVASDILDNFPNLVQNYELHISHSNIIEMVLDRIPAIIRSTVLDILQQAKPTPSQKRALLLKKGVLRSMADELEILIDTDEEIDVILSRLEKLNPSFVERIRPAVDEIKTTIQHATHAGVTRPIIFRPLMLAPHHHRNFKDGVLVEVVKRNAKRLEILAAGGRYDALIHQCADPKSRKPSRMFAYALQIWVERIISGLKDFQMRSIEPLLKEARSFGFWSPRRCDVYVVSYQSGHLQERLEVVSWLWRNNISADLMYESGLQDVDRESYVDMCEREGILFTVYPRPRASRRDQTAFKVKSILKGTEYDVTKQDLISWLQHEIREQKSIDLTTSAVPSFTHPAGAIPQAVMPVPASASGPPDVQLCLPQDTKKQRKQVKQLFLDRAYELSSSIKSTFQQNGSTGMPVVAIDVSPSLFDILSRNCTWVTDEEVWRNITGEFSSASYAHQVREAVAKKKVDGCSWVLLVGVREERVGILNLRPT